MARAGFYNENEYRYYPFLEQTRPLALVIDEVPSSSSSSSGSWSWSSYTLESSSSWDSASSSTALLLYDLPTEAIVDFGAIVGINAGFNEARHWIYLHRITRYDPYLIYEFRSNAPGMLLESLIFVRDHTTAAAYTSEWVQSRDIYLPDPLPTSATLDSSPSLSSSSAEPYPFCQATPPEDAINCGSGDCLEPLWEGFLVTGRFDRLLELIPDEYTLVYDYRVWVIEPARVQNLNNALVRSLNLANTARTKVLPFPECNSGSSAAVDETVYVQARCLQGDLIFREGYNCNIRQDEVNNTLVINGLVGGGAGQPCEEVPIYPDEQRPAGSTYYSGGPTCNEVVRSLNGKSARNFRIEAGAGFDIGADPYDPHTLLITATLDDFAICTEASIGSASC